MASAVERVQTRLQEAMDRGNQASLGQAIYASKGINGLKQLRRSAKARLKQLSADQNREMIGSHMPPEEPLTWRTTEQGDRYRAVAHLPTSIIGWVIGHKGCNARMLKQQTGTELWVDVPGQCVIVVAKALEDVEGAMEAVNSFVKTAPTFIAKVQGPVYCFATVPAAGQLNHTEVKISFSVYPICNSAGVGAGNRGGVTQTVHCPVHLLPSIQRLSRKIQVESGANYVFANSKMSTFCVTGDKKNVDDAVRILKRLIAEGNAEMLAASSHASGGDGSFANGDVNGRGRTGEQRNPGSASSRGWREMGHRIFQDGHDLSRQDGSPPTAPCSPEDVPVASVWGNGAPSQPRTCTWSAHLIPDAPPLSSMITHEGQASGAAGSLPLHNQLRSHGPSSAPTTLGSSSPSQGPSSGGPLSDLSFFSFGVSDLDAGRLAPGVSPAVHDSTAPTPGVSAMGRSGVRSMLPGLGFLEESAGAVNGHRCGDVDDEGRASSCGSGEYGGGEAHGLLANARPLESAGSLGVGSSSGGGGAGRGGGGGCPLEGKIEHLLEELGLSKYLPVFRDAEVDLPALCIMSEKDLHDIGILKGPRVKIMHYIGSRR